MLLNALIVIAAQQPQIDEAEFRRRFSEQIQPALEAWYDCAADRAAILSRGTDSAEAVATASLMSCLDEEDGYEAAARDVLGASAPEEYRSARERLQNHIVTETVNARMGIQDFTLVAETAQERIDTIRGPLAIDEDNRVTLNGRPLGENVQASIVWDVPLRDETGSSRIIVAQANLTGIACPSQYRIIEITSARIIVSPSFGTCAESPTRVTRSRNVLTMILPGFMGFHLPDSVRQRAAAERHIFVYDNGAVTENGQPIAD